ncbi:MAG: autorepressor SdpR family transcription factor [Bacteroidales bacterium]|nr:autorepressor SdpR family transcription factor [Bacteroidales bacterium]
MSKYLNGMNSLFKALNDPTRREILEMLKEGDMTAGDIAARFNMTKPSISHHLTLLKQADLVIDIRKGQFIYYSLNATVLDDIIRWFMQFSITTKLK